MGYPRGLVKASISCDLGVFRLTFRLIIPRLPGLLINDKVERLGVGETSRAGGLPWVRYPPGRLRALKDKEDQAGGTGT